MSQPTVDLNPRASRHLFVNTNRKEQQQQLSAASRKQRRAFFYSSRTREKNNNTSAFVTDSSTHSIDVRTSDMSLSYKATTTRHDDVAPAARDQTAFYVAAYGPNAQLASQHDRKHGRRAVLLNLTDEHATERMDVMVLPELTADKALSERFEGHFAWLAAALRGPADAPATYCQALNRGIGGASGDAASSSSSSSSPGARDKYVPVRWCQEHFYRAMIMRQLLQLQRRHEYRVYAALSPLHERTVAELVQIVNARRGAALEAPLTEAAVRECLAVLEQHELVRTAVRLPLGPVHVIAIDHARFPDYDHCLGRSVRGILKNLFPLAPGLVMSDPAYIENHRDALRRSVHAYRQERTVDILETSSTRLLELSSSIPHAYARNKAVAARNNSVRRVLLEHEVVRDILRAHHLGSKDELAPVRAPDTAAPSADEGDTVVKKNPLPRPIALIITSCSQLPEAPVTASPRSRSNSNGSSSNSNSYSGSGYSSPKTEATSTASSPPASSHGTPRRCNPWHEYTAADDDRFHLALVRALTEIHTT
jgi:hypothetical protein